MRDEDAFSANTLKMLFCYRVVVHTVRNGFRLPPTQHNKDGKGRALVCEEEAVGFLVTCSFVQQLSSVCRTFQGLFV